MTPIIYIHYDIDTIRRFTLITTVKHAPFVNPATKLALWHIEFNSRYFILIFVYLLPLRSDWIKIFIAAFDWLKFIKA